MQSKLLPAFRRFSSQCLSLKDNLKMQSWHIHEYGELAQLQLGEARKPHIDAPNKVLVKVKAASVNPIDVLMISGYGKTLFQLPRGSNIEFPLTVGRDFCGTVVSKGHAVENVEVGEDVYGFLPLYKQGSFSEIVIAECEHVLPKPKKLNFLESTALVYATMTAWSALFIFGNLSLKQKDGLRVLILGVSGGVGLSAVQLLKSQNCVVFGTCSPDAMDMVYNLSADCVFNYKDPDFVKNVALEGRYHIILDCAKVGYQNIPSSWKYDTFITLNAPLLVNSDNYGLIPGLVQSASDFVRANLSGFQNGSSIRWGFFVPSQTGFKFINELVLQGKLKPTIYKTFSFDKIPEALRTVKEGHLRGKVVIEFND